MNKVIIFFDTLVTYPGRGNSWENASSGHKSIYKEKYLLQGWIPVHP
jgi:hypothetical protein